MESRKRKEARKFRRRLAGAVFLICLVAWPGVVSAEEAAQPVITIEKPEGWKQGSVSLGVSVDISEMGDDFSIGRIEAKIGDGEGWTDITGSRSISISGNTTVYVRVTDANGNVYEQNRSVKCYDDEQPTLAASLTDGVLTIQGTDTVSGIAAITVNGTSYTDLVDGLLKIQLTQNDFTSKKIEITATDGAGNTSEPYSMQNPYYEWAVREAQRQAAQEENQGLSATTPSGGNGETEATTAPLPQDAQASEPTEARGTVDERTITGIEEELAQSGEKVDSIDQTAQKGGKEFYTISTKSGKIFYLIVDNDRQEDNVYFLTEVGEKDLLNFTLSDTVTLPQVDTVYAEVEQKEPETEAPTPEPETTAPPKEPEETKEASPIGGYLLLALAGTGALGAGYYVKIYKPKHEFAEEDEYEEEPEEDDVSRSLDDGPEEYGDEEEE